MKRRMRLRDWAGIFGGVLLGGSGVAAGAATSAAPAVAPAVAPAAAKGVAPVAGGGKAVKAPPSKEVLQQYLAALKAGRQADGKGQLAEARQQFAAAVALLPEGGAAQSELGWAAYRLKDLAAAEQATRAAVRLSERPSLRAASLYNLGRILVDLGKKTEAGQAYKEAWELARNPVTLAAWKALDPVAAAAAWPTVQAMTGPQVLAGTTREQTWRAGCLATLSAVIQAPGYQGMLDAQQLQAPQDESSRLACAQTELKLPSGGALQRVFVTTPTYHENHYVLSVVGLWAQTKDGWFYSVIEVAESWKWSGRSAALTEARVVGPYVELRSQVSGWHDGNGKDTSSHNEDASESDSYVYVLGTGPSGRPAVTSAIHFGTSQGRERDAASQRSASKTCPATLLPGGELQIGAPVFVRKKMSEKEFTGSELQTPAGTFQLKFP